MRLTEQSTSKHGQRALNDANGGLVMVSVLLLAVGALGLHLMGCNGEGTESLASTGMNTVRKAKAMRR